MLEIVGGVLLFLFVMMLAALWLGIRLARKVMRGVRGFAAGLQQALPNAAVVADPRWMRLSALLDRSGREQARVARERIGALLAERQSAALTPDEAQLIISCERRVPELIDTCLERCRSARPGERCDYAGETLQRLVRIGEEAEAARQAIRARDDGRLLTMHRYFDNVVPAKTGTSGERSTLQR